MQSRQQIFFVWLAAARLIQVPIIVAVIAACAVSLPGQMIELYTSLAQDVVFGGGVRNALFDRTWVGQRALSAAALGWVTLAGLVLVLWIAARGLARTAMAPDAEVAGSRHKALQLAGPIAVLPLAAAGIGQLRAATTTPSDRFASGLERLVAEHGLLRTTADAWFELIHSVQNCLWWLGLGQIGLAIAIGAALWLFCYRSKPADRLATPISSLWAAAAFVVFIVVSLASPLVPISAWDFAGSFTPLNLYFACLTLIGERLFRASRQIGWPLITSLVIAALILSVAGVNDNHRLRNAQQQTTATAMGEQLVAQEIGPNFRAWLANRPDRRQFEARGKPYPIYVAAAQGGGMYAAFHSATVLSALQDRCPAFASHLFAISAVSGGSLGAATFRAALGPERISIKACEIKARDPVGEDIGTVLQSDFLSPLIGYLLFPDFLQRLIPYPLDALDRSQALERVLIEHAGNLPAGQSDNIRGPYLGHWSPGGMTPALIFNTTEVNSGRRRVVSPFTFPSQEVSFLPVWPSAPDAVSPSVATAAILSARFPWLTPSAYFDELARGAGGRTSVSSRVRLVDGGYFENSGVSTAHDLIRALDREVESLGLKGKVEIYLLVFTSAEPPAGGSKGQGLRELLDPIRTLLNTREARGRAALGWAEEDLGTYTANDGRRIERVRKYPIEPLGYSLPLGWRLSTLSRVMIEMQAGKAEACRPDAQRRRGTSFDADCITRQIVGELDSGLK